MTATSGRFVLFAWVITAVLALTHVIQGTQDKQEFDEVTVRRINVVEPDGTLRMVISNHDALPRDGRGNRQGTNQRPGGGILFYNDEGRENGGLIFAGRQDSAGKIIDSGVSLSFDKYGAGGQMVQLAGVADASRSWTRTVKC